MAMASIGSLDEAASGRFRHRMLFGFRSASQLARRYIRSRLECFRAALLSSAAADLFKNLLRRIAILGQAGARLESDDGRLRS